MTPQAPALFRHEAVDSTQDLLHELAAAGAPAGTAIVAAEQYAGRGSRGRVWGSPRGGLWLSVLYRPDSPRAAATLSLRIGLAVARALEAAADIGPVRLKWPNDLIVADRKAGGILCEGRWQAGDGGRVGGAGWVAAGLGLNVANPLPADVRLAAVTLAELQPGLRPEMLVEPVVAALRAVVPAPDLEPGLLAAYAGRDWLRGRRLAAPVVGVADGLEADGALRVRTPDGAVVPVRAGTVVPED